MKNLRLVAVCVGSILVAASGTLIACSDDTSVNPGSDGGVPDALSGDTGVVDGGADTSVDPDADIDAGLVVGSFPTQLGDALCNSYSRCCFGAPLDGGAPVDGGGTFNRGKCLNFYTAHGFEESSFGGALGVDAGTVALDQAKASDCLAKVAALACDLSASELEAARVACFGAFRGRVADGQPCRSSIECTELSFCNGPTRSTGAPVGTCTPLRASGAACGDFTTDTNIADEACSYRASGVPGAHCDTIAEFNPTYTPKPVADWVCAANVANGENCNATGWCTSGICSPDSNSPAYLTCVTPLQYFGDPTACRALYVDP